jgi:tetratricopeptide (TPR) repeat protein
MAALRAMTDDIVENQTARGTTLTDENKEFLRKIIKHFEGFAAVTSDDAESRSIRAEGYARVGLMRSRLGELKEAEAAYQGARAIQKQLAADFPTRPEFRQELATSHNNLGLLLTNAGRLKEAEAAYVDALAIQKQLAAHFPSRPEFRLELARSQNNLGLLLTNTGRLKEAEAAYVDALAIQKQLAADFPSRPEFRDELATSHNNLGLLLASTGRLKDAEAAYADALAIQRQLAADFPNQPDLRNALAGTHVNLALVYNQRRDFGAAQAHLTQAQPHHQAALKANPRHPDYRLFYHNNLLALVNAHARLRDQTGAERTAAQLRELGWDPPGNDYDAACALALCIPIIQKDDKLSKEERPSAVLFYGDAAMKVLKDAIGKGYKDAAHMKKDTDLDPLRQREDFKKLIAELEVEQNSSLRSL